MVRGHGEQGIRPVLQTVGRRLEVVAAREAGATDEDLAAALQLHRQASFRWDFVSSENSTGFHSPQDQQGQGRRHRVLPLRIHRPLHGPRRRGAVSGRGFQDGDFLDTVHAESQAIWDIRRLRSWIALHGDTPLGVHGMSMGGFHTALLASLDDGLACAIAGIPVADQSALIWHHTAPASLAALNAEGVTRDTASELFQVVSPLRLPPLLPRERRFIYAGVADRFVPADQVLQLVEHWERPEACWYPGAHLSFPRHRMVGDFIAGAVRKTLLDEGAEG